MRPDLVQLRRQAKELLRAIRGGAADAVLELRQHHPSPPAPADAQLAHAQLVIARSYGAPSWMRLVQAVQLADAIWRDDLPAVRTIVTGNPALIREDVLFRPDSNWGPPMTYAANLGRDAIVRLLFALGARDLESAAGRAALQGKSETVRLLYGLAGSPSFESLSLAGPAYTLSVEGTATLLALGARLYGPNGLDTNAVEHLLGTDSRDPLAKHRILELWIQHGFDPPDSPIMALHRGRVDLLEAHLSRDPALVTRTFDKSDIFPLAPACGREPYTAQGTPLHGTTLLHIAAYFDELAVAEWLLDRGMDPDARSAVDPDGFGGYTALFSTLVSQRNFWVNHGKGQPDEARFTKLLLSRGADPNVRASLKARREDGHGGGPLREYHDVTALGWGEQYSDRRFVSGESLRIVRAHGGHI
ncbi:ankyrin repeat domain-containing protein [Pseudogemmatithrix spongiicola]|uniref:Ankyrin repeat domain-containing protein n=1 Tax=Pseudogemmatithrix spongiicola TaxID=3062599 RepID=A0AA49Q939_9BACT|nr:ankyrin repeat domain-containing protein [Gemmatimonadaceae bacterium 'strain 138']WKW16439.1 ankyrin repeat domain-containing protein [Gemmatimonadaceae bacterium 'strain 318']